MLRSLSRFVRSWSTPRRRCRPTKRARPQLGLEVLEDRWMPASLQVVNGLLTYTAGNGIANKLNVSASIAGTYTFQDTAETITVVGIPGAVGSGTKIVTLPTAQVPSAGIGINLGDKNDALTIDSTLHAVSVKG